MYSLNIIFCDKKLPIPQEVLGEFPEISWEQVQFLTNDLNKFELQEFEITEDGNFFLKNPDGTIEKQDFTGEITFSTMQLSKDYDYIIYFKSLFFKGNLKELNFDKLEKKENSLRKNQEKRNDEMFSVYREKKGKMWFKFYSFYYNSVVFVFALIRLMLVELMNLTWKIQRIIT